MTEAEYSCMSAFDAVNTSVLEAPRLRLRRLREDDAPALCAVLDDWQVARYSALIAHPYDLSDAENFIEQARLDRLANTRQVFAIERRIEGDLIGTVEIHMGPGDDMLGYFLGGAFWGRGYGTEAVLAMVRFAFGRAGHGTVSAAVHPDNPVSMRVLEKAGFVRSHTNNQLPGRCQAVEAHVFTLDAAVWQAREDARPKLLVTAVALVDVDGRVLMARRPAGKSMAGLWEFPGGKVEASETPEEALVRELREELGVDISESCLAPFSFASHAYEDFHLIMMVYVCRTWKGTLRAQEGQTLKWLRPMRLNQLPMPPADIPLVAMLMDFL